jgi:hypothetical protein
MAAFEIKRRHKKVRENLRRQKKSRAKKGPAFLSIFQPELAHMPHLQHVCQFQPVIVYRPTIHNQIIVANVL